MRIFNFYSNIFAMKHFSSSEVHTKRFSEV